MTKIGQYEIIHELGRGDVSIVYLAYDAAAGREVALKMICLPESFSEEQKQEYRAGFLREAKASLSLNHAGIVTTYDCHDQGDEGEPYTSMEYVAGRSLKALFEGAECREPGDVFAIVEATTDALHAAHRVGVFHGKPLDPITAANLCFARFLSLRTPPTYIPVAVWRKKSDQNRTIRDYARTWPRGHEYRLLRLRCSGSP